MAQAHPFDALLAVPGVAGAERAAADALAAVHRRPVNLRRPEITSSEAVLRGARLSAMISGLDEPAEISAYSLLAPAQLQSTAATFQRAPLQTLARLDTLLGGPGTPSDPHRANRLSTLASLIAGEQHHRPGLLPAVVYTELATHESFGPRSGSIARIASRIAAVMTGFDPRGLAVPETYFHRHRTEFETSSDSGGSGSGGADGSDGGPAQLVSFYKAWEAGAAEAEGIARAV